MGTWNTNNQLALKVALGNTVANLVGLAVYTGATTISGAYTHVTGACLANQAGTFYVDGSYDATNWDGQITTAYVANDPMAFKVPLVLPYFRIRFVNGAAAQGSFALYWYGAVFGS